MKNIINTSINKALLNRNGSNSSISIAYLILVHRLPEQFKRLFKAIYDQDNFYLIYIDNKSSDEIKVDLKNFLKPYKNVNILIKENVIWGGYSMVQAEIDGIKELLKINLNWDYFINLSGQDYPLKSQKIIKEFLSNNVGKNYLKFANQLNSRPETMNRLDNYFIELKDSISPLTYKRPFMKNVIPFIGGQWMILTRNCCSFICNSNEVKKFEKFYANNLIPDE